MKQQQDTDEKLLELIDAMNEVYSFVGDVDFLVDKIRSVEEKTLTIVKQTVECALFIQEYTAHGFTSESCIVIQCFANGLNSNRTSYLEYLE
jgi:hypothetical protein